MLGDEDFTDVVLMRGGTGGHWAAGGRAVGVLGSMSPGSGEKRHIGPAATSRDRIGDKENRDVRDTREKEKMGFLAKMGRVASGEKRFGGGELWR